MQVSNHPYITKGVPNPFRPPSILAECDASLMMAIWLHEISVPPGPEVIEHRNGVGLTALPVAPGPPLTSLT